MPVRIGAGRAAHRRANAEEKMHGLLAVSRWIDAATRVIGQNVAWLIVVAAVISAGNAAVRKLFDISSNAWLELQWWLFAAVFLLAAPWTLALNEHIRIDIVNERMPRWIRNAIEIVGHVFFLLPMAALVAYTSWDFFVSSWQQNEQSSNYGGLPQWPVKFLIPLAFALLFVQGISELIKRIAIINGDLPDDRLDAGRAAGHLEVPAAVGDPTADQKR
jgi:TRAP-type mannitol/chloroaromatic compound transport system permease small subunit